jgi:hypothetical protein
LLLEFCKTHTSFELRTRGNDMITLFDKRDKSIREFRIVRNIKFTTVRRQ